LKTLRLRRQIVEVDAPQKLVFEIVASAGKTVGRNDAAQLVEFETEWRGRVMKTVEEVRPEFPREIAYRWVKGPLEEVEERIRFEAVTDDVTRVVYTGNIGAGRGVVGRLRTLLFVRPVFNRLVREHLEEGRRIAEKRAQRSRVHRPR